MPDLMVQFLGRLAVMLPVILVLVAGMWAIFNRRHHAGGAPPFSAADMRTWTLRFSLLEGAVFAVAFALLSALTAESTLSAGVAGGLAVLIALAVVPRAAAWYWRRSGGRS